jgi:hypothetical protein
MSTLEERSAERRKRMVAHTAHSPEEAEAWDLEFWQSMTPVDRMLAFSSMLDAIELTIRARRAHLTSGD